MLDLRKISKIDNKPYRILSKLVFPVERNINITEYFKAVTLVNFEGTGCMFLKKAPDVITKLKQINTIF